jgi:hypothetical protein
VSVPRAGFQGQHCNRFQRHAFPDHSRLRRKLARLDLICLFTSANTADPAIVMEHLPNGSILYGSLKVVNLIMEIDLRPSNKACTDHRQRVLLNHFVRIFPASIADERTVRCRNDLNLRNVEF